jgi:hypothetical protein
MKAIFRLKLYASLFKVKQYSANFRAKKYKATFTGFTAPPTGGIFDTTFDLTFE